MELLQELVPSGNRVSVCKDEGLLEHPGVCSCSCSRTWRWNSINGWVKYPLPAQEHTNPALSSENHQHFLPAQATAWERTFLAKVAASAKIYGTATALQIFTASKYPLIGFFSADLRGCSLVMICGAQSGFCFFWEEQNKKKELFPACLHLPIRAAPPCLLSIKICRSGGCWAEYRWVMDQEHNKLWKAKDARPAGLMLPLGLHFPAVEMLQRCSERFCAKSQNVSRRGRWDK